MFICRKVIVEIKNYYLKIVIFLLVLFEYKIMLYNVCWYMYLFNNIVNIGNLFDLNIDFFFLFI